MGLWWFLSDLVICQLRQSLSHCADPLECIDLIIICSYLHCMEKVYIHYGASIILSRALRHWFLWAPMVLNFHTILGYQKKQTRVQRKRKFMLLFIVPCSIFSLGFVKDNNFLI